MFACCHGDLCGGRRVFNCWQGEVGAVITGDAIEVVSAGGETGGYELLVVVGGELLDTAACLIEDVEAGLERSGGVASGCDDYFITVPEPVEGPASCVPLVASDLWSSAPSSELFTSSVEQLLRVNMPHMAVIIIVLKVFISCLL